MDDFSLIGIKKVMPLAVQVGNLSGARIIAKITFRDGEEYTSFLFPPDYLPFEKIEDYIINSAVVKYGYLPLEEKLHLSSREELEGFLKSIERDNII